MARLFRFLAFALLLLVLAPIAVFHLPFSIQPEPKWQDGDLIFQSTPSVDALGINFATMSFYSHVGIIDVRGGKPFVLDSAGSVGRMPLSAWVERGWGGRYAVYRDARLNTRLARKFLAAARPHMGKKYDFFFMFDNDELYCSELPYLMYRELGLRIGKTQRLGELSLLNPFTYELIKKRWIYHPQCQVLQMTFDQCYDILLEQKVISPSALANDPHLQPVYSNYLGGLL